jgi:hypothetical protein
MPDNFKETLSSLSQDQAEAWNMNEINTVIWRWRATGCRPFDQSQ